MIVIGPSPPPYHGVAVMTTYVVDAARRMNLLAGRLDTADRRGVETLGRLDVRNVSLALRHVGRLVLLLLRCRPASVYMPISQGTWGFVRDFVFVVIAKAARRSVILHLHGADFDRFYRQTSGFVRLMVRACIGLADEVWVLTPSLTRMFRGLAPSERLRILPNGIDDPMAGETPVGRESAQSSHLAEVLVLYLGNLYPGKGAEDLLAALALLEGDLRCCVARLIGEVTAPVWAEIVPTLVRLQSLGARVAVPGAKTGHDKVKELASADIFVYPTRWDGQPLVLLEAMAAGLAIITTRVGGIPETVEDGVEAVLVDPGDHAALADAIHNLLHDEDRRRRLGRAARRRYEAEFTSERFRVNIAALLRGGARTSVNGGGR
jgi:glycosyltransferase involved in cell wall biosynthesis